MKLSSLWPVGASCFVSPLLFHDFRNMLSKFDRIQFCKPLCDSSVWTPSILMFELVVEVMTQFVAEDIEEIPQPQTVFIWPGNSHSTSFTSDFGTSIANLSGQARTKCVELPTVRNRIQNDRLGLTAILGKGIANLVIPGPELDRAETMQHLGRNNCQHGFQLRLQYRMMVARERASFDYAKMLFSGIAESHDVFSLCPKAV